MALEPRQLRAFLAIVQNGSHGRAADTLHLAQPALSRVAKQMNDQLHVQLFERCTTDIDVDAVLCGSIREDEDVMLVAEHRLRDPSVIIAGARHPLQSRGRCRLPSCSRTPASCRRRSRHSFGL